jgi:hypothetical protein
MEAPQGVESSDTNRSRGFFKREFGEEKPQKLLSLTHHRTEMNA